MLRTLRNCTYTIKTLQRISSSNLVVKNRCLYSTDPYQLQFENVPLTKYVDSLIKEYEELKNKNVHSERVHELSMLMDQLHERKIVVDNLLNLKELLQDKDADIRSLAEEEKRTYDEQMQIIDENVKELLVSSSEEDNCKSMVLEINAGVGGQEAMLFASELFKMYSNFVEHKGWESILLEYATTDIGGIRYGSMLINGTDAFKYLKYEAGVHRVQRIPSTEKAGRVHTSTVSVLALPQPTDIQIKLDNKDLKFETKRASGAGGQHVNTTDSAVRIVHIPTGVSTECQVDRSQIKNKELALQRLKSKLYQLQLDKQLADTTALRKSQVRTNFRNEKIRTYNFSQDRITDHRLQNSNYHNLKVFLDGGNDLDSLMMKLQQQFYKERLLELVSWR